MPTAESPASLDFIRQKVADDLASGKHSRVVTRFPPEPNGYLHIGHAKSMCLNFGLAMENQSAPGGARCNLRFDDTNPVKEEQEYIDAIKEDIRWLGFDWGEQEFYASDYFQQLYDWAVLLIKAGKAYVDDSPLEDIRRMRGTVTKPGEPSEFRERSPQENLDLFERMKAGEFPNGSRVLRAKIDLASPNMNMRDPVIYRILHSPHPRTGDAWCIYPMYDFAHGQSDWIEGVTHSLCTLEFEAHRPLYDWCLREIQAAGGKPQGDFPLPQQTEFAKLNLTYTMMSKRRLLTLVQEGVVTGWNDPRMPTLRGMRRRGYPAAAIRKFCTDIGLSKRDQVMALGRLETCVRDELNQSAPRVMGVLNPLKVVIENYPSGQVEEMDAVNNPEDESAGMRKVPFTRELFIEQEDFMEDAPKKFFRLSVGREVRLRYAYWITCTDVVKDDAGNVIELRCTYDPETRGGNNPPPDADGKVRKVKGTLHWVSADHAVDCEVRLYDHLFSKEDPSDVEEGQDWQDNLNPDSLQVLPAAKLEPAIVDAAPGRTYQFERNGYFCVDTITPRNDEGRVVFNRTVTLKDTWAKVSGGK